MLNLRDIFSVGRTQDTAFVGLNYTQTGVGFAQDGANFSRKIMVMNVATNPAAAETIVVGGKTYTFRVSPTLSTEVKIGNLVTDGNFANANAAAVWYGKHWTYDATGALHVALATATGSISAFTDYKGTIGGAVLVTSGSHGLLTGDEVVITSTTNYNGTYQIVRIDGNTFYIFPQNGFVADDATGTWTTTSYVQPLVQEWTPKPVVGKVYTVVFTYSGRSAGSIVASCGGANGASRTTDGTYTEVLTATTDGYLTFTPSTDFDGKISSIAVTEPTADLKAMTAQSIADRINLDTTTSLCTAYTGLERIGVSNYILVVANTIGTTPTFTADGVKVVAAIAFTLSLTEAQLENVLYFKKDTTTEKDVKPTVLTERNSGTANNYLY